MMTLQGMADHRFTSVSLFTNVFLGEIIFFPLIFPPNFFMQFQQLEHVVAHIQKNDEKMASKSKQN